MEELVIKKYARIIGILCFVFTIFLASVPDINAKIGSVVTTYKERWEEAQKEKEMEAYKSFITNTKKEEETPTDIMIPGAIRIPIDTTVDKALIEFTNDYMNHSLTIFCPGVTEEMLEEHPIVGNPDYIVDLEISYEKDGLYVEFITETVIEPTIEYQDEYMFLTLNVPKDIYERIVVLDAGHGGNMPGMVVNGIKEKDVNLEILLKIKALLDEDSTIKVYYTRLTDVDILLERRVGLANELEADLFLSVHLNSYGRAYNSTNGTMTMYNELIGETDNKSKSFAKIINDALVDALGTRNLGVVKGSSILIIRESKVPVALTEIGFMSNKKELEDLTSEEYQDKIALAIYETIKKALNEGY